MNIAPVTDPSFARYGGVWDDIPYEVRDQMVAALRESVPLPKEGTAYVADVPALHGVPAAHDLELLFFAGLPTELGCVCGHNTKLNSLEYHRSSEFNLPTDDLVLLLAKREELDGDFCLDTSLVRAFLVPAGTLVEVYADTLHYTPCHVHANRGFRMLVALPEGTNGPRPADVPRYGDGAILWGANKWVITHESTRKARQGAHVGLMGENIDVSEALADVR